MKIISASTELFSYTPNLEQILEVAGRVCYKSEDKITDTSGAAFIGRVLDSQHESVLEHGAITVRFICDRGVSHELVRHRIASFSQESTRYCNYSKGKFGGEITVIRPLFFRPGTADYIEWERACSEAENVYLAMLSRGVTPQEARSVLPNSLKTEIVITANPREWRWIFTKRCTAAHPQMTELMVPLAAKFAKHWPSIFGEWTTEKNK